MRCIAHATHGWGANLLPDGKSIVFSAKESGGDYRAYLWNVDGGSPKPITPDGKAYAYSYNEDLSDLYMVEGLKLF